MSLAKYSILAAAFLSAPVACQRSPATLRDEIASRYAAMKLAMANHDEAAIRGLLADGFTSVDVSGNSEDATKMIGEVLALPPDPNRQSKTTVVSARTDGRTALVEQRYEMSTTKAEPNAADHAVALSTLSSDTWVKKDGAWRLARTVTRQIDYSVDGVTVAHKENTQMK